MSQQPHRSRIKPMLVMATGGGCIIGSTWGPQLANTGGEGLVILGICLLAIGAYLLIEALFTKGDITAGTRR